MQMFLWSNIFFSLGFDVKDHYKDFGGDYAAYVAPVGWMIQAITLVLPEGNLRASHCQWLYLYIDNMNDDFFILFQDWSYEAVRFLH